MASHSAKLGLSLQRYDELKAECLKGILEFFRQELNSSQLDCEQKESLGVAKQCLEACYDIDESHVDANPPDIINIFNTCNIPPASTPMDDEYRNLGEMQKAIGNECMKNGNYAEALIQYSKAIALNPTKAIFFCNRAAAYSRLERHQEAIKDCLDAIELDPSYGKAYGRLGIAYANLSMYREASDAYKKALQLDPTNTSYETNLKLAEEKLTQQAATSAPGMNFDFSGLMNNPALLNMATQMMNDPSFRNIVTGIMQNPPSVDNNLESFVEVGQQLANHMQQSNPEVLESIRVSFTRGAGDGAHNPETDEAKDDSRSD